MFFVGPGHSIEPALEYCDGCPVRQECLDYAIAEEIPMGIFGGMGVRDRRRVARTRQSPRPVAEDSVAGAVLAPP